MSGFTAATTQVSFSAGIAASYDQTGYEALTWTASTEITSVGEHGRENEIVTFNLLHDNSTNKRVGTSNEGSQTFEAVFDSGSAAQGILETAEAAGDKVSVKIAYSDGDVSYYEGIVTSLKRASGGSSDIIKLNISLEIEGGTVVRVDA